ncbi:hypothetical protein [Dyella silvatica]|uniref:hypothetical protein n=1 Tax=Dyella silvatica TaxID=2992128 RepID=UPI0022595F6A|nr:hypothetical protein [Dyella silvatica]
MDIWKWVQDLDDDLRESGQHRIADLIQRIPHELHENHPERVEAMLPEALAAARAMQNRMRNLFEGEKALPEAVALLEFAHRDETRDCPQSICVTQDIAICYGNVDGPGWVPERLALCEETLSRIDPSRPCYDCISREYADALMDAERNTEAKAYLERQAQAILQAGGEPGVAYQEYRAHVLFKLGQFEQALAELKRIDEANQEDDDDGDRLSRNVWRALTLAKLGRTDEAWEMLPSFNSELVPSLYDKWSEAVALLLEGHPERNTWQLGRLTASMVSHMDSVGAHRLCIVLALRHGELALRRQAYWTAQRALAAAQRHLPLLRIDGGAAQAIADFASRVAAESTVAVTLPVPAEQINEYLRAQEESNPEQDIDIVLAAYAQRPDDAQLADLAGSAMSACGANDEAKAHLWAFVRRHPEQEDGPTSRLLQLLLQGDDAEVIQLASLLEPVRPVFAQWCLARLAFERSRWKQVGEHVEPLLQLAPDSHGARRLWAAAAMADHDFNKAVALRQALVDASEAPSDDDWDLMTAASAAGDWAVVRQCAARVGMQLSNEEGPVREQWGWLRLRYEEDGETFEYFGRRTGPVTAEVASIAGPRRQQHVRDQVVFDAQPLESPPENEEEREGWLSPFRVVHTLSQANYRSWFVDGAHPGEQRFETLREAIEGMQWSMWVTSPEDYSVLDPVQQDDARLPGIYLLLATPPDASPILIDRQLGELTAGWEHPWCWRQLAEEAGHDVDRHEGIIEAYGL